MCASRRRPGYRLSLDRDKTYARPSAWAALEVQDLRGRPLGTNRIARTKGMIGLTRPDRTPLIDATPAVRWKRYAGFAREREALEYVRDNLPDTDPVFLFSNFEFIGDDGPG